jgi:hypothetical protein
LGTNLGSHKEEEVTETNGDPREGLRMPNFELPDHELLPFDL